MFPIFQRAFKLHKEQESTIAESLVLRIRELQCAGAEVNIHDAGAEYDFPNVVPQETDNQRNNIQFDNNSSSEHQNKDVSNLTVQNNSSEILHKPNEDIVTQEIAEDVKEQPSTNVSIVSTDSPESVKRYDSYHYV